MHNFQHGFQSRLSSNLTLKLLRRQLRRIKARLQHGSLADSPILFANSFPKSGTHLLTQVLGGFVKLGPFVDSGLPAMTTFDGPTGKPRPVDHILKDLNRLQAGDIGYGHLHAIPGIMTQLTQDGMAAFFIYRDPRDVVVSHVHYVTEMELDHAHHHYYANELGSFDERLRVSILGRPEAEYPFPDIYKRFEPYLAWLEDPNLLSLRFEDFINHRSQTLEKVLNFVLSRGLHLEMPQDAAKKVLDSVIQPRKSPTFRSGTVGKWRESFNDDNTTLFKDIAGELLIRLGYEIDNSW